MNKELTAREKIAGSIKHDISKPLTWKNFSFKKTFVGNNWSYFLYWILIMLLVFLYKTDTAQCMQVIENINQTCTNYCFNIGKY